MIVKNNPDSYQRELIKEAIANNDGYCCCKVEHTIQNKCMCEDFRNQEHYGFCHCGLYYKVARYPIITLCGSTKFKNEFMQAQKEWTLRGYIVLSVGLFGHSGDNEVWSEDIKQQLDEMHKAKIEMSNAIYVINKDGYIGESTRSEIEWAQELGKQIYYMEQIKEPLHDNN